MTYKNEKMKCIVIITNGFPYGDSERSFFSKEYEKLCNCNRIILISLNPNSEEIKYTTPGNEKTIRLQTNAIPIANRAIALFHPKVIKEILYEAVTNHNRLTKCILSTTLEYSKSRVVSTCLKSISAIYDVELIYTYWCTYATYAAVEYKKKNSRTMVISRFHGYDLYSERSFYGFFPFRRQVLDDLNYMIFACDAGKQYISNTYGNQYDDKSFVKYIGAKMIDNCFCALQGNELCIISCSNIIQLKRIDRIIDALALIEKPYTIKWIHIGDGPLKTSIENYAALKLGNKSNICYQFTGFVENNKLSEIINIGKPMVFITTTSSEGGAPVTIQEMFSAGIPAIGTNVGGIPEMIVDGVTGILLDEAASDQDISRAIISFINMTSREKDKMSKNAINMWSKKFQVETNSLLFSEWVEDILRKG